MTDFKFITERAVEAEETRYYEFKEVRGGKPVEAIKNACDEYVVAFLNSAGGRILWGIRDADRNVVGVVLSPKERDELRKVVTSKLNQIQPPISPTAYQINLHCIYEDETFASVLENKYVVEIIAPEVFNDDLYSTGSGEVFVKTDSGKRKLNFQEIQDEIRRRQIQKSGPSFVPPGDNEPHATNREQNIDSENFNVIAVKEALKLFSESTSIPEFSIRHIRTPAELNDLWSIDNSAYRQLSIDYDLFYDWWRAFPQGLKVLFYGNHIVGAIGIWPLSFSCSDKFKQGRLRESDLSANMFRSFRTKPSRHQYISGIVLRTDFRKTNAIKLLIGDGLDAWLRESLICYPLEILALGYSMEGQALLERFGFIRFQNPSTMPDRLPLYRIEIASQTEFTTLLEKRGLSRIVEV